MEAKKLNLQDNGVFFLSIIKDYKKRGVNIDKDHFYDTIIKYKKLLFQSNAEEKKSLAVLILNLYKAGGCVFSKDGLIPEDIIQSFHRNADYIYKADPDLISKMNLCTYNDLDISQKEIIQIKNVLFAEDVTKNESSPYLNKLITLQLTMLKTATTMLSKHYPRQPDSTKSNISASDSRNPNLPPPPY